MLPQTIDDLIAIRVVELSPEFIEGEVNDVMMVEFLRSHVITQFEPDAVQQVDLLRREMGSMGAEIEDMLLSAGEVDDQCELRFWI